MSAMFIRIPVLSACFSDHVYPVKNKIGFLFQLSTDSLILGTIVLILFYRTMSYLPVLNNK